MHLNEKGQRVCDGEPPRLMKLLTPWWENVNCIFSCYICSCPPPVGGTKKDLRSWDSTGWQRWADDPEAPPLHKLSKKNPAHIRKYA